jgi:hypothetical protein
MAGQKHKQVYREKVQPVLEPVDVTANAGTMVLYHSAKSKAEDTGLSDEDLSTESNKKQKQSGANRSADQAEAVMQPRHTQ